VLHFAGTITTALRAVRDLTAGPDTDASSGPTSHPAVDATRNGTSAVVGRSRKECDDAWIRPRGEGSSCHSHFQEPAQDTPTPCCSSATLGGILIGFDVFGLGWRVIFLVNLPVIALVLVFGLPLLRNKRAEKPRRPDFIGMLLSILTLGCVVVPLIKGREAGWPIWTWVTLVAAPMPAILFWRYESRLTARGGDPLVDPASLGAPGLRLGLVVALLLYVIAAFFLLLSVYLQGALSKTAFDAGLVFLPSASASCLGPLLTPLAGRIFGSFVNPIGMGLEVLGFVVLALLVSYRPAGIYPQRWLLAVALFVSGFRPGACPSDIGAGRHRAGDTGLCRHDCRHCQLDLAGGRGSQRRSDRGHLLHCARHAKRSCLDRTRFRGRDAVHGCVFGRGNGSRRHPRAALCGSNANAFRALIEEKSCYACVLKIRVARWKLSCTPCNCG
jgi:hypothetical protein